MSTTPGPGIYAAVPFCDYLAWDAVSNSKLSLLAKSPRHYQHGFCKEPPAMKLGQLYHCGVLEPLAFAARYAVSPDFHLHADNCTASGESSTSRGTRYVKEKEREFAALTEGREVVEKAWYDQVIGVVRELTANEQARQLLNDRGPTELSIVWNEEGILCKARIDKVAETCGALVDLKSTADITKFTTAIGRYGYHRQMAHYQAGWAALNGGELFEPWLVAVESSAPHAVQAAPLCEEAVDCGADERLQLLNILRDCLESGVWPGLPNPKQWNLPAWATEGEPLSLTVNGQTIEV